VAGTAAPIRLNFLDAWGSVTGSVFPTGRRIDLIDGIEVTCIDAAMPLVILRARDLGLRGRESPAELDADRALLVRIETIRLQAGARMGLGDVSDSVVPKPVIVSEGDDADSITSRYFTPRRCHASHAVTGAIGVATAFALPGTVASGTVNRPGARNIAVLHPQGRIDVEVPSKARTPTPASTAPRSCARPARSCRATCTSPTTCSRNPWPLLHSLPPLKRRTLP
jgi:2-methylaconitate cis-trans-isomerase PrpF